MLAKREVYRWHFVYRLANRFSHLAFRRSRQAIGIEMKRQQTHQPNVHNDPPPSSVVPTLHR